MIGAVTRPKKRVFLALTLVSLCLAALSTYGLWKVSSPGLATISSYLPNLLGIVLVGVILSIAIGFSDSGISYLELFPALGVDYHKYAFSHRYAVG